MNDRRPVGTHPFPTTIAGCDVIDTARIAPRDGELADLAVITGYDPSRPDDRAYVVWDAAVRTDKWTAYSGLYDLSYEQAIGEFERRVHQRI